MLLPEVGVLLCRSEETKGLWIDVHVVIPRLRSNELVQKFQVESLAIATMLETRGVVGFRDPRGQLMTMSCSNAITEIKGENPL